MKVIKVLLVASMLFAGAASANTEVRSWVKADGTSVSAAIVSWDIETGDVVLRKDGGETLNLKLDDFSERDQVWVKQWSRMQAKLKDGLMLSLGEMKTYQTAGDFQTDYYVYYPSKYKEGKKLPLMLLFHPTGMGMDSMLRHYEAAEEVGMILVTADTFMNTKGSDVREAELRKRFEHFFPLLENQVEHDPQKIFMGGMSGGAWRAFHYSAYVKRPWAGIYSNVGWLGGEKFYDLDYPGDMRVAMVNGHKDYGHWYERDTVKLEGLGNKVKFFIFEGGHQMAPKETQVESFKWLLGMEE